MTEPVMVTAPVERGGERVGRWRRLLGGLGWAVTFLAIYTTTNLSARIGLDAVGISTTAIPRPSGDPENPPGQFVAIIGSGAFGVLATVALRRWCQRGSAPGAAAVEAVR